MASRFTFKRFSKKPKNMYLKALTLVTMFMIIQSLQNSIAQVSFPVKKIYAFYQPVSKGVENKQDAKKKKSGNYYVYVETTSANVSLNHIWINDVIYHGELKEVSKPVSSSQPKDNAPIIKKDMP